MKARPILFSTPMIRAILEGCKTQTRRTTGLQEINIFPDEFEFDGFETFRGKFQACFTDVTGENPQFINYLYEKNGGLLWVRESFLYRKNKTKIVYRADLPDFEAAGFGAMYGGWKPSIHMPKWASRLTLKIKDIRVERLHDISEQDAVAEGMGNHWIASDSDSSNPHLNHNPKIRFERLWESINGVGSWAVNPFVWVIEFEVLKGNMERYL